jgi:hypothetical protein
VPSAVQLCSNGTTSPECHGPLPSQPPHAIGVPSLKLISISRRRLPSSGSETVTSYVYVFFILPDVGPLIIGGFGGVFPFEVIDIMFAFSAKVRFVKINSVQIDNIKIFFMFLYDLLNLTTIVK